MHRWEYLLLMGFKSEVEYEFDARTFIEKNIDLIDKENWERFFWNMLDNPDGVLIASQTADYIIDILQEAQVEWDENVRFKVFKKALHNTLRAFADTHECSLSSPAEIRLLHIYYLDQGYTIPEEDQTNWLGYSIWDMKNAIRNYSKDLDATILNPQEGNYANILVGVW